MSLFNADITTRFGKNEVTVRVKVLQITTSPVMYMGEVRQVPAFVVERIDNKRIYVQPAMLDGGIVIVRRIGLT